jgi:hypothetical protein
MKKTGLYMPIFYLKVMALPEFRDKHAGERVFLVGNGPSLKRTPLELLEDEYSIAMNKIDLLFEQTSWRPTYYLNVLEPGKKADAINGIGNVKRGFESFIASHKKSFYPDLETVHWIDVETLSRDDYLELVRADDSLNDIWSDEAEVLVYRIESSIYTAVQLAWYMGFDEMYFIGCDLYPEFKPFPHMIFKSGNDPLEYATGEREYRSFLFDNGRPIRSFLNGVCYKVLKTDAVMDPLYRLSDYLGYTDNTHFADDYNELYYQFAGKNRDLIRMHMAINLIGELKGFETYNATCGGELEVYQRVDLEAVVEETSDAPAGTDDANTPSQ